MSGKAEKTCPLCTEEMDLTDQQLKPCKCGYEICVWCWNHIMEMAAKDGIEGRCPACRIAYDRQKIVGLAANCERVVAGMTSERRQKSMKPKPKASEGRLHLHNVRVIQRNLVYIIGLPLNLADEDLLHQKEYFGQYGLVLKVSISRAAPGTIQQPSNNSCNVYITYSTEEDAIRCIQSVHSYVLDGRPLRAYFGTTKYCHAWIRNMPCKVSNCLYLHHFASQEDSFMKDEIDSAVTRSRRQQIIGATNNMHRRSGNVLPAPAKPIANNTSNNMENHNKGSSADVAGKSSTLPCATSWVARVSATLPPSKNLSGPLGPSGNLPKVPKGPQVPEAEAISKVRHSSKLEPMELMKAYIDGECLSNTKKEAYSDSTPATINFKHLLYRPSSKGSDRDIATPSSRTSSVECTTPLSSPGSSDSERSHIALDFRGLCSGLSSIHLKSIFETKHSIPVAPNTAVYNHFSVNMPDNRGSEEENSDQLTQPISFPASMTALKCEDSLDFNDLQLKAIKNMHHLPSMSSSHSLPHNLNQSSALSWKQGVVHIQSNLVGHSRNVPMRQEEVTLPLRSKNLKYTGVNNNDASSSLNLDATFGHSCMFPEVGLGNYLGKHGGNPSCPNVVSDVGENNIISKILSIDSNAWEDSLTLPHSLIRLMSENIKEHDSFKMTSFFKESDCRQSRFSFARQEEFSNDVSDEHSLGGVMHSPDQYSSTNGWTKDEDNFMKKHQNFSSSSSMDSDNSISSRSFTSSSVSKTPTSAPLGFAEPSKTPPPGFPNGHGTMYKPFDSSVSHFHQILSPAAENNRQYCDISFNDHAIVEVSNGLQAAGVNNLGSDTRQTSSPQLDLFDHEIRLQQLMQQSNSGNQNLSFQDHSMNRFSPPNDPYCISAFLPNHSHTDKLSSYMESPDRQNAHMSNGHLGSLNRVKVINDMGVPTFMTNGGLGF